AIRDVMAGRREAWAGEYPCHSPGEQRFFSVRITPCSDPTLAVVIHHENITARRQLEEALRASNERFALVQLATGDVTWDWEMGRRPEAASRDLAAWESRVHPADRQRVRAGLDEALRDGTTWTAEYRYLMDERSYVAVYDRRTLLRDGQGHPERLIGSMQDVSERSRLTAALEQSEHHYRRLVERAPHMIYALDRAGRFIELNPAGAEILQRATAELLGRRFEAVIVPDDHRPAGRTFRSILIGLATTLEGRVRVRRPSGEERWLQIDAAPILDGATVVGAHGIARDITDERERDTRMRLFAAALENLTECVNVLDGEGRIVYANAAHARMLGYEPAAPPAAGMQAFAPDAAAADEFRAVQLHVRGGRAWRGRLYMRRGDGGVIPVETHMERVEQDGRALIFAICRDVSAELEHEHRLRRAERLASMGTLLGGVAHELNNPLAAVVGFTQLLLIDDRPDGERDDLETIQREAQRMAAIIADLRRLSRDSHEAAAPLAPVDLNDVARHVLRTRAYALRTGNVEVREELEACLPPVLGDRGQLEQVVLNVVVNAEHAMRTNADGGVLVVRTRISSRGVTLEVGDTGCGIAPEQLGHIFDPFFTTKPVGEGTGLGLSLVHSIVSEHGGQIHAESTVGVGTTLRIDFRAALPAELLVPPPGPGASAIGLPARVLRILVVDDEDPVRHVVARYLTRRGHRVDEATDGSQALALLDRPGHGDAPYDVILSDLRMPGLGGAELLARLRRRGDGTERRLIFLTGDTAPLPGSAETDTGGIPVLSKPIDLVALGRIVEQAAG
ncbi:MAG TPA: PAS domain S-box protein, partial [Longimicrobiaceae bacterium]|nr:PAS domain S-box protein [Longimicrobiaceae bacterium]